MTEYHDGLPILPPVKASEAADKLRIQIIGVRAGWSAWAAREAATSDERWLELMKADQALRAAEAQLEVAIEHMKAQQ
jgi:hypothetical protein